MKDLEYHLHKGIHKSTDKKCPVAACCRYNNKWYYGTNKIDRRIPKQDRGERTELFYNTVEHAEINMLKKMGNIVSLRHTPVYVTLFPCDRCMKVLADKYVKTIYYIEDHPESNWSKRSHEIAKKNGILTVRIQM